MGNQTITRRNVAKGAAWSVPAVVIGAPAALAAASSPTTVSATICGIHSGDGTVNNEGTYNVNLTLSAGDGAANTVIPSGTTATYTFTLAQGGATANDTPAPTPSSSNSSFNLTVSPLSGRTFTVTLSTLKDLPNSYFSTCSLNPYIVWQNTLRGGTDITETASLSGANVVPVSSGLHWQAARRYSGSAGAPHLATKFLSKSGAQACYPYVDYDYGSHSNPATWTTCGDGNSANDTSTTYPDGTCVTVSAPFTSGAKQVSRC